MNDKNHEIEILKGAVKSLARMNIGYRLGQCELPPWVFLNINKVEQQYGITDLTKLI